MPTSATLVMIAAALITAALIAAIILRNRPSAGPSATRILAEHVVDMVSTHDPDGSFRYVSTVFAAMLGEYPGSLVGKQPRDFAHPDDALAIAGLWKRALVWTGTSATSMWRCRRHNGEYVWLESTARASATEMEELGAIVCVSRDITERKQIEDALRDSESRFRTAIETVRLVAVGLDPQGHVTFCNDALCTLTGWPRARSSSARTGSNAASRPATPSAPSSSSASAQGTSPPSWKTKSSVATDHTESSSGTTPCSGHPRATSSARRAWART